VGPVECPREQDLLDAFAAGRWPERCEEDLRVHVSKCGLCEDLVQVVAPLKDDGERLWPTVRVPSSGTVWWRAQTRARREAAREAARPVTVAQALGTTLAVLALVGLVWVAAPWLTGLRQWLPAVPSIDLGAIGVGAIHPRELAASIDLTRWWWVIAAVLGWLVIAPLAIYFALVED
jgi:hypothetical protein